MFLQAIAANLEATPSPDGCRFGGEGLEKRDERGLVSGTEIEALCRVLGKVRVERLVAVDAAAGRAGRRHSPPDHIERW